MDENPIRHVRPFKVEEKRNYFIVEECKKIFALIDLDLLDEWKKHFRQFNILFRLYLEFLLNTGLRRNEALSLQKSKINFGKRLIYVERTKGKKYRIIPLNNRAFEILKELGDDLFTKINSGTATHKFNDLMKRLGLIEFKLHSLRHTFATNLVSAGVDILAVKELLGHQDIRTSMAYAKADTDSLRRAVDQLKN